MSIAEPTTMATDFIMGLQAIVFSVILLGTPQEQDPDHVKLYWGLAMLWTAIAAFAGGVHHGLVHEWPPAVIQFSWIVVIVAMGLAGTMTALGSLPWTTDGQPSRTGIFIILGLLLAYLITGVFFQGFLLVIIGYGSSFLFVAVTSFLSLDRHPVAARWMLGGIAVSFLGAFIQQSGFTLHRDFNHNDLYHVIQMTGTWMLYRGARAYDASA